MTLCSSNINKGAYINKGLNFDDDLTELKCNCQENDYDKIIINLDSNYFSKKVDMKSSEQDNESLKTNYIDGELHYFKTNSVVNLFPLFFLKYLFISPTSADSSYGSSEESYLMSKMKKKCRTPYFLIYRQYNSTNKLELVGKVKCNFLGNIYWLYQCQAFTNDEVAIVNNNEEDLVNMKMKFHKVGAMIYKGLSSLKVILSNPTSNKPVDITKDKLSQLISHQDDLTDIGRQLSIENEFLTLYSFPARPHQRLFQMKGNIFNNLSLVTADDPAPVYQSRKNQTEQVTVVHKSPINNILAFGISLSLFHHQNC